MKKNFPIDGEFYTKRQQKISPKAKLSRKIKQY